MVVGLCVCFMILRYEVESMAGDVSDEVLDGLLMAMDLLHRGDCLNRGMCDTFEKFSKLEDGGVLCFRLAPIVSFLLRLATAERKRANQRSLGLLQDFAPALNP
jgi:hypothetical protein